MRGIQGLAIAGFLGLLGLTLNWVYLQQKTKDVKTDVFIGIRDGVDLQPGDIIKEEHLMPVSVPVANSIAGNLKQSVYLFERVSSVVNNRATRRMRGGELYFRDDFVTPTKELELEEKQRLIWVPVDSSSFVPSLVDPGDQITFILPVDPASRTRSVMVDGPGLTPSGDEGVADAEFIGPFTVKSLGNRLSSMKIASANHSTSVQERQVGIIVNVEGTKFEAKAMKLLDRLQNTNSRNIKVSLHPKKTK